MKKIVLILLALLFSANILFATTSQNEIFLKKVDETFVFSSAPIMISTHDLSTGENRVITPKRESYPLWLDIKTLENVEHNSSQKILKEKMDKLVGYNDLFSKEALAVAKKNNYRELRYNAFFERLFIYLSYLEKHNDKKENSKGADAKSVVRINTLNYFYFFCNQPANLLSS